MLSAYVISLNNPVDLLKEIKIKHGLNSILVKGVNGEKLNDSELKANTTPFYSQFGPKSAIGCAMAHIKVWKQFLSTKEEICVVFEDDVIFNHDFSQSLKKGIENVPKDFDLFYIGCSECSGVKKK